MPLGESPRQWLDAQVADNTQSHESGRGSLRLRLFPRAETAVRQGHPWIYSESIRDQNREGEAGELAVIYDRSDRFLAIGFFEPDSPIRVRLVHQGKPAVIDYHWWRQRLTDALSHRASLLLDEQTNGLRLVNGDSEGFPGLVIDRYADTLVVKLYCSAWLCRWQELEALIREVMAPEYLVLRMSRNLQKIAKEKWAMEEGFCGEAGKEIVVFKENSICFEANVLRGQKTGFFLDQRDNRSRVESLAAGRRVLNVFSFSGGFSLYAARGGATSVTDLDISAHALTSASRNFELNAHDARIASVPREQVQADAFEWIAEARRTYDLIVVDPPSLAKRQRDRDGAIKAYERLNRLAIERLAPGGILLAASCSAHVTEDDFHALLGRVCRNAGRPMNELWRSTHAVDHPASFAEAKYLKACCLQFTS